MRTLVPARLLGIAAFALIGAVTDLMLVADGLDLHRSHFSAADLAQSGLSSGRVAAHGDILLTLGLLPLACLILFPLARLRSADDTRLSRTLLRALLRALIATQAIAILAAFASVL